MIKSIFFDFDGVLTLDKNDIVSTCDYLAEMLDSSFDDLYAAYEPYAGKLYAGKMTLEDFWAAFQKDIDDIVDIKHFYAALNSIPKNDDMFVLAQKLSTAGYKIGIVTNQTSERAKMANELFDLEEMFEPIIVSSELGFTKSGEFSDEKIFKTALAHYGNKPDEAVFVDNTKANLLIPFNMGIKTVYFDENINNVDQLSKYLENLGLNF